MSRQYTAQDMRELAEMIDHGGAFALTDTSILEDNVAMLRQAADDMEREEKREKKYEYSVNPPEVNGVFHYRAGAELRAFMLQQTGEEDGTIVRREVGEWEEVDRV